MKKLTYYTVLAGARGPINGELGWRELESFDDKHKKEAIRVASGLPIAVVEKRTVIAQFNRTINRDK